MHGRLRALACLLALAAPAGAQMKRFESDAGFSFRYPPGWIIASERLRERALEEMGRSVAYLRTLDFSRVAVCVLSPDPDGFSENLQVVVTNERIPDSVLRDGERFAQQTVEELSGRGIRPRDVDVKETVVDGKKALAIEWTFEMAGAERDVRSRRIVVPGNGHTYVFTLSAAASEFADLTPTFDAIVATIRVDDGILGLWFAMTPLVRHVVGAVAVGLMVLLLWIVPRTMRPVSRLADRRTIPFDPVREGDFKGIF